MLTTFNILARGDLDQLLYIVFVLVFVGFSFLGDRLKKMGKTGREADKQEQPTRRVPRQASPPLPRPTIQEQQDSQSPAGPSPAYGPKAPIPRLEEQTQRRVAQLEQERQQAAQLKQQRAAQLERERAAQLERQRQQTAQAQQRMEQQRREAQAQQREALTKAMGQAIGMATQGENASDSGRSRLTPTVSPGTLPGASQSSGQWSVLTSLEKRPEPQHRAAPLSLGQLQPVRQIPAAAVRACAIAKSFRSLSVADLQRAIVAKEILDSPLALRSE